MAHYLCKNCNAEIQTQNIYCPQCGKNISDVGKIIKVEIIETIGLSDNSSLSNTVSGSFSNISGSISVADSIIKAIPEEKLKEIGLDEKSVVEGFASLNETMTKLEAILKASPHIKFDNCTFNAPVNTTQEGDNIVITTDITESFNRVYHEIEKLSDTKVRAEAKAKVQELQEEISKEEPNVSKVRKALKELKAIAPIATIAQLGITIGKLLVGLD